MNKRFAEQRAIVIGAGIGGLAAAAALANHFGQVVVLERDELPADARPRPGAAQTRHLHVLLSGGAAALAELFPGFLTQLVAVGAQRADVGADAHFELAGAPKLPRRELNIYTWQLSRPLLEAVLREQLRKRENVQLRELSRVIGIVADENNRAAGVRFESREGKHDELNSTLVIDASGRGVPTLDFLKATGRPTPAETAVSADLTYGTTVYSFPAGAEPDFKQAWVHGEAPEHGRAGFLVKRENGLWDAVLAGRLGDVPPTEDNAYLAFADSLPSEAIGTALRRGRREAPIVRFGYAQSRWRHFADVAGFPAGLLPLGDAVCSTNPVFGQGMTVAATEAVILHRLLAKAEGNSDSLESIGPAYLKEMEELVKAPWSGTTALDLAYPQTKGERPADMQQRSEYQVGVMKLAAVDPDVHRLMVEVRHLVKPAHLLHAPNLQQRVRALLQHPAAPSS
ncbi:FAD-dependent monooxygenase [Paraburkholderia sp. SARCC-3016]|uniref:NAD(P)/FAD-dependent oxidoreductase n=1 Tax=Paraburkholderia sp. SARCC-3016 TaxID=3058611 RepID=UPI002807A69F|nr:FAD-dependent monooxygenase [Paraburkholderia sp. SARCC-3016]MDQ7982018.1 FAD-dependent monooxygenase [Paraburkholderia sp. SARCC-3016]